jgi:hypothetical protein
MQADANHGYLALKIPFVALILAGIDLPAAAWQGPKKFYPATRF